MLSRNEIIDILLDVLIECGMVDVSNFCCYDCLKVDFRQLFNEVLEDYALVHKNSILG